MTCDILIIIVEILKSFSYINWIWRWKIVIKAQVLIIISSILIPCCRFLLGPWWILRDWDFLRVLKGMATGVTLHLHRFGRSYSNNPDHYWHSSNSVPCAWRDYGSPHASFGTAESLSISFQTYRSTPMASFWGPEQGVYLDSDPSRSTSRNLSLCLKPDSCPWSCSSAARPSCHAVCSCCSEAGWFGCCRSAIRNVRQPCFGSVAESFALLFQVHLEASSCYLSSAHPDRLLSMFDL